MNPDSDQISRRHVLQLGAAVAAASALPVAMASAAAETTITDTAWSAFPLLTRPLDFVDVSRGTPRPFKLTPEQRTQARLTEQTWRMEITADPFAEAPHTRVPATLAHPLTLADGTALDLAALIDLGKKYAVHFLKAMQCLNIDTPLGQGLWTGIPVRHVLRLCGRMNNVRRVYFWGFHNDDPKQIFQSSLSYTQAMETAPGELPAFVAYQLNGAPIPIERGGPVRMIVPWSHGYKSIKWLQHIFVTNDARNNDSYANGNNDPDSFLKTAAYLDESLEGKNFPTGQPIIVRGLVISGLSGLQRVEYWVRKVQGTATRLADDDPELLAGPWVQCALERQPDWEQVLPAGIRPQSLLGFDPNTGRPNSWPTRYGMCSWGATVRNLAAGQYELRARAVDGNGFAQPEPRPSQKSGKNAIQMCRFGVV